MKKIYFIIFLFFCGKIVAQNTKSIQGRVLQDTIGIAGVHIQNLQGQSFTISDEKGYFSIKTEEGNTLQFTHISFQTAFRKIVKEDIEEGKIQMKMKTQVTELEGVEVTKYQKINAQDLGILQHTPVERTYFEKKEYANAKIFQHPWYASLLVGALALNPIAILNAISGRTKMIQKEVMNEKNLAIASYIIENFSEFLQKELKLSDEEIATIAFFVMEKPDFHSLVAKKENKTLQFMLIEAWGEYQKLQSE